LTSQHPVRILAAKEGALQDDEKKRQGSPRK
jgi:hypothetical protein